MRMLQLMCEVTKPDRIRSKITRMTLKAGNLEESPGNEIEMTWDRRIVGLEV